MLRKFPVFAAISSMPIPFPAREQVTMALISCFLIAVTLLGYSSFVDPCGFKLRNY